MFQQNWMLQCISILCLICALIVFGVSFLPGFREESHIKDENEIFQIRLLMIIVALGFLRGAFS